MGPISLIDTLGLLR